MTAITFDWTRPPLTANQRLHWRKKAALTSDVRNAAHLAAGLTFDRDLDWPRIEVGLTWVVTDKRRRDVDNIVPTLKALCDGLVDAGIVPDDTPEYMVKRMPEIRYEKDGKARLILTINPIGDAS